MRDLPRATRYLIRTWFGSISRFSNRSYPQNDDLYRRIIALRFGHGININVLFIWANAEFWMKHRYKFNYCKFKYNHILKYNDNRNISLRCFQHSIYLFT